MVNINDNISNISRANPVNFNISSDYSLPNRHFLLETCECCMCVFYSLFRK